MNIIELNNDEMLGKKPFIEPIDGVFIAGGAIRQWFSGFEKESDVDIFAPSLDFLNKFKEEKLKDFTLASSNKNAITYKKDNKIVQLIQAKFYKDIPELFDSFDYTLCQFAWTTKGITSTKEAVIAVLRKHLAIHKINKDFAVDSLRRAFKYHNKGFEPCMGTIRDLCNSFKDLTQEQVNNQVEISPGGGRRNVRFD